MNCNLKECKVCSWLYMRKYLSELWGIVVEDTGSGHCLLKEASNKKDK